MFLDTGSSLSIISKKVLKEIECSNYQKCSVPILFLANGTAMVPFGRISFPVKVGKTDTDIDFIIYDGIPFDVLLGLDFCLKTKIKINFENLNPIPENELEVLPFYMHDFKVIDDNRLCVKNDDTIQPMSGKWISITSESFIPKEFVYEPKQELFQKLRLLTFSSLISNDDNNTAIFIVNPNNYAIKLRKNMRVGSFHLVKNSAAAAEPRQNSELKNGKNIKFNINEKLPENDKIKLESFLSSYRSIFACNTSELTRTNLITHKIETESSVPVHSAP